MGGIRKMIAARAGEAIMCGRCRIHKKGEEFYWKKRDGSFKKQFPYYCAQCERELYHLRRNGKLPEVLPEGTRRCTRCKKVKEFSEFYERITRKKERVPQANCKECVAIEVKERRDRKRGFVILPPTKTHKFCHRCKEFKKKNYSVRGKLGAYCVECTADLTATWRESYPEKYKKIYDEHQERARKRTAELDDTYVRLLLTQRSKVKLTVEEIPPELIKLKRAILTVKRMMRK